jgi:small ligand-binding sensory domain FIST
MPFAAGLSTAPTAADALLDVCSLVRKQLGGSPDLAVLFFSVHHLESAEEIAATVRDRLEPRCLLGCVGDSIVGNEQEIERGPALSLWGAKWTRPVEMSPFHLVLERTSEGASLLGWPDALVEARPKESAILLLGDPFTLPVDFFLDQINDSHAGLPVLGGMASGVRDAGQCRLILSGDVFTEGGVGVLLQGEVGLRSIVSQGCRPIGTHMVITKADANIIEALGGKPPLAQLQQMWDELSREEQDLFQQGLHIGRVINEYQGKFQRGDFLVRNVLGLDRTSGALAITERVRVGQTVQFHVRDAATADEDLHALLRQDLRGHERRPGAALLFTCNGRGTRLFQQPHHDAGVLRQEAGPIPVAGFFAQGELGPVGGQNFIHGFTASIALFEE